MKVYVWNVSRIYCIIDSNATQYSVFTKVQKRSHIYARRKNKLFYFG